VCLIGLKSDDEIKAIINNTFDGKLPSERNLKGLTQDLKNINVFANKSGEELRLVGAYSNAEIPPMIESAVLKAILAEVKVAKEEKSSLVLESSSDSTTVSVDAAEMKNSPRIPAALSASSNGSGIGR
ncbi:MAG: hypothetical protein K0R98_760, partial [Rickettsiaceae bacterium]|nr:hypothetical protein [Rickettsiaceae bacterium]